MDHAEATPESGASRNGAAEARPARKPKRWAHFSTRIKCLREALGRQSGDSDMSGAAFFERLKALQDNRPADLSHEEDKVLRGAMSHKNVSSWETQQHTPRIGIVLLIWRTFRNDFGRGRELSLPWLAAGEGPMTIDRRPSRADDLPANLRTMLSTAPDFVRVAATALASELDLELDADQWREILTALEKLEKRVVKARKSRHASVARTASQWDEKETGPRERKKKPNE